ncbi:TonB-dependent receptor plug [Niastella koreensis GR20-10]|uniref:TonB-dependent receptor plug n=1 Tax=Niastella koreensis (strain DSM 17620 / KACC 11465 / NBRC 106392 / GR20-10) TaxID=700598 RepID=G8T9E5_NIAKG|nr:TonB-dependent receptor [Niastella koreensis]AEV99135.1 TonB-dependent receptor plug [Niastella koreensis GR20-10]
MTLKKTPLRREEWYLLLPLAALLFLASPALAQDRILKVTGKVTDELDKALNGVTIRIAHTIIATATDKDGFYTITVSPADSLEFSYTGYRLDKQPVKNRVDLNVKLAPVSGSMDEVTVIGYGQQKKVSVVGSQATVSPEDLKLPARDIAGMLAGRISGIITTSRGGGVGNDNASVLVRGVSTFGTSTRTPLIIIDGVPDRSFNDVDPEDIQNFTVLKDATSTAVYGTRGANGVILINTKRGVAGKPSINVEVNSGVTQFVQVPEMLDAPTWMTLYNESLTTRGRDPFYTNDRIELHRSGVDPDLYPNTDWHKELFRDFGLTQRANFNVSGGAEKANYYISGGYYNETGLIKPYKDDNYDTKNYYHRYNFTANIGVNITGTTKLDLGIATIVDKRNGPYDAAVQNAGNTVANNLFEYSLRVAPHVIPARYSDGTWPGTPNGVSSPARFAFGFGSGYDYSATIRPNIRLKQDLSMIIKGLSVSGLFSFDVYTDATVATQRAARMYFAEGRDSAGNLITRQLNTSNDVLSYSSDRSTNHRMYSEASLNYSGSFANRHEVSALLLFNQSEYVDGNATTFTTAIPFRNRGLTGRATYGFDSRYFVEGNFGYTGSENFAPSKRYGFFPSFGVGWVISNENFFEPLKDALSYFKLRYSYGLTGNGGYSGNRFLYLDMLTKTTSGVYQFGTPASLSTSYGGYSQSQIATDATWETSYRHNLGVEMNFLHNDLKLIAEVFRERREDVLRADQTIPNISGFGSINPVRNIGVILNKGVDISLSYNKSFAPKTFLTFTGTFTYNKNKNLQDGLAPQPYPWMEWKGHEVDAKELYTAVGLFQSKDEIDKSAKQTGNVQVGDIKYLDKNGDGVINNFDVSRVDANGTPKMMYGMNIAFGYKGFDIGAFVQGTGKVWLLYGAGDGTQPFASGANSGNLYAIVKDRWTEDNPNPHPFYPRLNSNQDPNSNFLVSDWWLHPADFIRLKSAELGYTLPAGVLRKNRIKNLRIYLNGTNLYTISKWKYWDPELNDTGTSSTTVTRGGVYPNIRAFNFGVRATF